MRRNQDDALFDIRQRRSIVIELALIPDELALELRDARFDLALAFSQVLRVDDQLCALLRGE